MQKLSRCGDGRGEIVAQLLQVIEQSRNAADAQERLDAIDRVSTDRTHWPPRRRALCVLEMFIGERTRMSGRIALQALENYLETGPEDESIPKMPDAL